MNKVVIHHLSSLSFVLKKVLNKVKSMHLCDMGGRSSLGVLLKVKLPCNIVNHMETKAQHGVSFTILLLVIADYFLRLWSTNISSSVYLLL